MLIGKIFTKLFFCGAKATKVASKARVNPKLSNSNPVADFIKQSKCTETTLADLMKELNKLT